MYFSALIGNPTDHSVSDILFEELVNAAGIAETYKHLKINVKPASLGESISALKLLGFCGANVTLPYKLDVLKYLDSIDPIIDEVGAVNTIAFGDKIIGGYNTDWIGFTEPIRKRLGDKRVESAVIFGTGGAARAAIYAAKQLKADNISVLFRDEDNENLIDLRDKSNKLEIDLVNYNQITGVVDVADLIINATSTGMIGHDPTPFDLNLLIGLDLKNKLFFDAVFNPVLTPLMKYFESQGAETIDGLWMMIYQALEALSIWLKTDISLSDEDLISIHKKLEEALSNV